MHTYVHIHMYEYIQVSPFLRCNLYIYRYVYMHIQIHICICISFLRSFGHKIQKKITRLSPFLMWPNWLYKGMTTFTTQSTQCVWRKGSLLPNSLNSLFREFISYIHTSKIYCFFGLYNTPNLCKEAEKGSSLQNLLFVILHLGEGERPNVLCLNIPHKIPSVSNEKQHATKFTIGEFVDYR